MSFSELMKIGVEISLTGDLSKGLQLLVRDLTGLNVHVDTLKRAFGDLKSAAIGAGMAFGGIEIAKGLVHATEVASEFVKQQQLMIDRGRTLNEVNAGKVAVYNLIGSQRGNTQADALKSYGELSSQFGSANAESLLPDFSALKQVEMSLQHKPGDPDRLNLDTIKLLEARGAIFTDKKGNRVVDQDKVRSELSALNQTLLSSNGLIGVRELLQMARQGGAASRLMSKDAFYGYMGEVGVALGGSKAGTAMYGMFQQMELGTMTKKTAQNLKAAGMMGKDGHITHEQEFRENPFKWVQTAVAELKKKNPKISDDDAFVKLMGLFGRQTTQRAAAEYYENRTQIEQSYENYKKANPDYKGTLADLQDVDMPASLNNLSGAFTNFETALGEPLVKPAIAALNAITDSVNALVKVMGDHPTATAVISSLTAGIATFLVIMGTAKVLTAAGDLSSLAGSLRLLSTGAATLAPGSPANAALLSMGGAGGLLSLFGAAVLGLGAIMAAESVHQWIDDKSFRTPEGKAFNKATQAFSIFDRSTWDDPKAAWWDAQPKGTAALKSKLNSSVPTIYDDRQDHHFKAPVAPPKIKENIDPNTGMAIPSVDNHGKIVNNIYLDGKKIATNVIDYLGRALNGPIQGTTGHDTTKFAPVGPSYPTD